MNAAPTTPVPPIAAARPFEVKSPFGTRTDPYYWLRDGARSDPEVLAYLAAGNANKEAVRRNVESLENGLSEETVGRIKQDDSRVPARRNGWWYYSRYVTANE